MAEPDFGALKDQIKMAWSLGDYAPIADRLTAAAAEALVEACAVSAGQEVLDVAAGTGNVALLAAREGARVVASDLTPAMVEAGRARTQAAGVDVEWVEADAEALPFEDESFDCVTSAFGAMFAPRPDVAARELVRVVRPGGTVGLASWTADAFVARQRAISARYAPPPPVSAPDPYEWGDPEIASARFDGLAARVDSELRRLVIRGDSLDELIAMIDGAGPQVALRRALSPDQRDALSRDMRALYEELVVGSGPVELPAEYLLVVARKRG